MLATEGRLDLFLEYFLCDRDSCINNVVFGVRVRISILFRALKFC